MAEGGAAKIPITAVADTNIATENQGGTTYSVRAIYLSSDTGNTVSGVNLSISAGYLALTSADVPASGRLTIYTYVPVGTGQVTVTMSKAGFLNTTVQFSA